jgi:hypothetical protein
MSGFIKVAPRAHQCDPPNPWIVTESAPQLRYGVGTVWECHCGQQWVIPLKFNGRGWQKMGSR